MGVLYGSGRDDDNVSRFSPKRNSDAVSREKREKRPCASHALFKEAM